MNRPAKIGIGIVAALVVIIAAVVVVVFVFSGSLIKTAVEEIGSKATQTAVRLNEADVSLTSGAGALRGLTVGNPQGFKTKNAFSLGEISVKLDTGSLGGDPVVIKEIVIAAPQVTYEIAPSGNNIDVIRRNVDAFAGKRKAEERAEPGDDEGPKLIIEHLYIRGGKVDVSAAPLEGKTLSAALPDLHLTDIGKGQGGVLPAVAVDQVMEAVSKAIGRSVSTLNLDQIRGMVQGGAKGMIEKGVEGVGGAAEEGAKGLGGAVRGVLGGDKN